MIEIPVTKEMLVEAEEKAKAIGLLRNSITDSKGNLAGALGEVGFKNYFSGKYSQEKIDVYNWDVMVGGKKFDVKTKECYSPPTLNYEGSVTDFNKTQKCDFYLFARVLFDKKKLPKLVPKTVYLIGFIKPIHFYDRKYHTFHDKGEVDENIVTKTGKPFVFSCDCFNIEYNKLIPIEVLENELNKLRQGRLTGKAPVP